MIIAQPTAVARGHTTSQRRTHERSWTPIHLDFVVEQIEPAVEWAVAPGARLEQASPRTDGVKLARMADLFGHGFRFVQFLWRGYDEIAH